MGSVLEDEGIRGELVRVARTDAGLTQVELAEMAGISFQAMSNIERGAQPKPAVLRRIARATGRTTDWFFGGDPAPPAPSNHLQKQEVPAKVPADTQRGIPQEQEPVSQPDMPSLLAQLVAAQVQTEAAMAALAHAQMESRAEAARTSARISQIEEGLRALLETPRGGCGEGEETRAG